MLLCRELLPFYKDREQRYNRVSYSSGRGSKNSPFWASWEALKGTGLASPSFPLSIPFGKLENTAVPLKSTAEY